ncbi:MAG TPA: hypothetical protein VFO59_02585 [Dehalococcoidia bacterium]|nr:hypothetical protein [Dehalococcoidia bacterium]
MPDMPQTAAKGSILKNLDQVLGNQAARAHTLARLQAGDPLLDIMSDGQDMTIGPDERRHLDEDWFGDHWWPGAQAGVHAIEQILRAGFIGAINKADELGVPIDTYWICHPGPHHPQAPVQEPTDQHVEVTVLWSDQQVTVIIHTPEPGVPIIGPAPLTIDEPIRVWFWKDGEVKTEQPKHRP